MQITIDKFTLQLLDLKGVKTLMSWAEAEGWNPGIQDAEVFYGTDPQGFYGYFIDEQMIAGGAVVSYNDEFGFMGLFIVDPAYRALGIGRKLWYQRRDLLLSRLQQGAAIGMDGVVAMQPFYGKGGFVPAFRGVRYQRLGEFFSSGENISAIMEDDWEAILYYDKTCFGFQRPQFLIPWLKLSGSFSFKYIADGTLLGYAVMRRVMKGYKICPLFADNQDVAEALYRQCLSSAPGEEIFLDIPEINLEAIALAGKYQAEYVFECARMYYGNPPDIPLNKIFGITSFELG